MKETEEPKKTFPKRFYLKWPWNVIVYIVLAVVLRVFAIPLILLIMWWNKKQQPDGPEEGYCLQRTRGRLTGLIPATLLMAGGPSACIFSIWVRRFPERLSAWTIRCASFTVCARSWERV